MIVVVMMIVRFYCSRHTVATDWARTQHSQMQERTALFTPKGTDALVSSPSVSRLGIYVL